MSRCAIPKGFVTVRRCDVDAAGQCPGCGRPVCNEHWTGTACVECAAGRGQLTDTHAAASYRQRFRARFSGPSGHRTDAGDHWFDHAWYVQQSGILDSGEDWTDDEGSGWDS
ncbi:hypothetical protein [Euzebya rosea]|uniref:hypothetical protein n=1 Tax=Euzebya rosea TaxID=2052804 RepID=UPI000D3EE0DF|nr:hypothetical protein [Euzebya rosea]